MTCDPCSCEQATYGEQCVKKTKTDMDEGSDENRRCTPGHALLCLGDRPARKPLDEDVRIEAIIE